MRAVTLAVTRAHALLPGQPHLPCSPKKFPPSTERAYTEREVGIEKTAPSGMEEGICTRGSRRKVRVGQPNTGEIHQRVRDGPYEGPVRTTNHAPNLLFLYQPSFTCTDSPNTSEGFTPKSHVPSFILVATQLQ